MRTAFIAFSVIVSLSMTGPVLAQTALPGLPAVTSPVKPVKPPVTVPSMAAMTAPININTAPASLLDTIPHIGPKRAASIIKNRPYKTIDDLVAKKAIPNGIFQKIKSHLTV